MAKYGNYLNTIVKKAEAIEKLSDLPEIIRPYQYNCNTGDKYSVTSHNKEWQHSVHTKVGFIGNQDMAYYFDFPGGNTYDEGSYIKQIKGIIESLETRSPTIIRSYLEDTTKLKAYKISNVGNQSMSFSFGDYDVDIYIDQKNLSDVKNNIFFMYYYPTQSIYIFFDSTINGWSDKNLYLKFTPKSEIDTQNTLNLEHIDDYTYRINGKNKKIKDISSYQIYYEDDDKEIYRRIPDEYIESITYQNDRYLKSQQISYFTQKTRDPNFIELKDYQIMIKFHNIDKLKNNDKLYIYVSDVETDKNDMISNINIKRHSGAKVLFKKIKQSGTISNGTNKTDLIYNILANEKLVYQDHLYFDIKSAELYFEDLGPSENKYKWFPYIADGNTPQSFPENDNTIYLRIDYFLNDEKNNVTDKTIGLYFIEDDNAVTQDNTKNIPFFNYSDTFKTLPDAATLECTDVVFVKDSTDTDSDEIKNDTAAIKGTISSDFVINSNNLAHEVVRRDLEGEGNDYSNAYKVALKTALTGNNIVNYSRFLVSDLNGNGTLSTNIENFSSFLNISMDDGDDVISVINAPVVVYNNMVLSIQYKSNYDYFILKDMDNRLGKNIKSIDFGIGQYPIDISINASLAKNAIHIDIGDKSSSYLPFIQYLGQDLSGHPTWYIPNFADNNGSQVDIYFNESFAMNIRGFCF